MEIGIMQKLMKNEDRVPGQTNGEVLSSSNLSSEATNSQLMQVVSLDASLNELKETVREYVCEPRVCVKRGECSGIGY